MTWLRDPATLLWLAFSVVVALIGAALAHDIYRDAARHRDAEDVVRDLDGTRCWACHRTGQRLTDGFCDECGEGA